MTIQSPLARISYTVSGAGPYSIPFMFIADADLVVYSGGSLLTLTSDYTLTGAGSDAGGTLTLVSPSAGESLVIINDPEATQLVDYPEYGKFPAQQHERALDKLTILIKRALDLNSRTVRVPDSSTASGELVPEANKFIAWNSDGTILVNSSGTGTTTDAQLVVYAPAGTGAVATNLQAVGRRRISVFDYMTAAEIADVQARAELVDVRAKVQKAIDYASSVHGVVEVPPGVYIIGDSGSDMSARSYGLLLKSNCEIVGESARLCVFKTKAAADIDLLTTDRTTTSTNIALRNLTLDGNADGTDTDLLGFNAWISGVTNLTLDNIISQYPESWGLRIQKSSPVRLDNITCYHDTATNADGIHFVDCSNVTCTNLEIYSEGDDGFVIEAINADVDDYSVAGLKVTSTGARGILIFSDPNIVPAARTLSNINITGAVVSDCASSGIVFQGASFNNIKIDAVVTGSNDGLYIVPGTATYPAVMRNCKFDVLAENLANYGAISLTAYSTYKNNEINVNVYNPGDGYPGVSLAGDYWHGSIVVDYDPNSDKASPSAGVVINGDFNDLRITSIGGANNSLQMASTAQDNNIRLGLLSGAVINDLALSGGATRNHFSGGKIAGAISLGGNTGNTFDNVAGATFYGTKSLNFATLGTGDVVVAHGLSGTPTFIGVTLQSGVQVAHIQPIAVDGTNITFRGWNTTGPALITTGTYTINLDCRM